MGIQAYDDAREEIFAMINPVAPPEEVIAHIVAIAEKYHLTDRRPDLIAEFFDYHDIDPARPPAFILRSGYQVLADSEFEDLGNHLIHAILGESIGWLRDQPPETSEEFSEALAQELGEEIVYIVENMHEDRRKALLSYLLYERTIAEYDSQINECSSDMQTDQRIERSTMNSTDTQKKINPERRKLFERCWLEVVRVPINPSRDFGPPG